MRYKRSRHSFILEVTLDSSEDEHFMRLALDQAKIALDKDWIPVGAVFVRRMQIVAHGRKTGDRHTLFDHAEHNGCYQALWDRRLKNLAEVDVYTTLEPCLMCLSMLMTARVRRIVYAFPDPYGGGTSIFENPAHLPVRFRTEHPTIVGNVLREESRQLLRQYFIAQRDKGHAHWSDRTNPLVELALHDA